jgi:hypothetical protein
MDNQDSELDRWANRSVALLAPPPDWVPQRRPRTQSAPRPLLLIGVAAALVTCIGLVALLPSRALAQPPRDHFSRLEQVWYWFTVVRPSPAAAPAPNVRLLAQSDGARADLTPHLLRATGFSAPRLTPLGPATFGIANTIVTLRIETALDAEWSDAPEPWSAVHLTQGPAPVLNMPPGFDIAAGFRNAGRARALARQSNLNAAALLFGDGTRNRPLLFRDVRLETGPALLIEDLANNGVIDRLTLVWSDAGRAYALRCGLRQPIELFSFAEAGAIADGLRLANTVR